MNQERLERKSTTAGCRAVGSLPCAGLTPTNICRHASAACTVPGLLVQLPQHSWPHPTKLQTCSSCLTDVATGGEAQAADQAGAQVRNDVAVQVGHAHDIKLSGPRHQLQARGQGWQGRGRRTSSASSTGIQDSVAYNSPAALLPPGMQLIWSTTRMPFNLHNR